MKIIISENQVDKIKSKIHEYVKKYGFEKSREIFGDKVLLTIGFNNDPMEFLNLFNDLDVVQSEDFPNQYMLFRYEEGKNLMVYDRKNDLIYINYNQIWSVLRKDFNLTHSGIVQTIMNWLSESYGLIVSRVDRLIHSPTEYIN
jgi:hypothetical protein